MWLPSLPPSFPPTLQFPVPAVPPPHTLLACTGTQPPHSWLCVCDLWCSGLLPPSCPHLKGSRLCTPSRTYITQLVTQNQGHTLRLPLFSQLFPSFVTGRAGCPGAQNEDQAGLELRDCLPLHHNILFFTSVQWVRVHLQEQVQSSARQSLQSSKPLPFRGDNSKYNNSTRLHA